MSDIDAAHYSFGGCAILIPSGTGAQVIIHTADHNYIALACSGHLMSGDFNLFRSGVASDDYLDASVEVLLFFSADSIIALELVCIKTFRRKLVCVHIDFLFSKGLAEGICQNIYQYVVQGIVAAVSSSHITDTARTHGVAIHCNTFWVNIFESAGKIKCVILSETAAACPGKACCALARFVADWLLAHALAVGVNIEHHVAAFGKFLGDALHCTSVCASAVCKHNAGQLVTI